MAKKKQSSGFQGKGNSKKAETKKAVQKKSNSNQLMIIGVVVVVLGLATAGMVGVFQGEDQGSAAHGGVQLAAEGAEQVSIESGGGGEVVAEVTDRETRFLGPATNPAGLTLAEAGHAPLDGPTLVWFHADW